MLLPMFDRVDPKMLNIFINNLDFSGVQTVIIAILTIFIPVTMEIIKKYRSNLHKDYINIVLNAVKNNQKLDALNDIKYVFVVSVITIFALSFEYTFTAKIIIIFVLIPVIILFTKILWKNISYLK